MTPKFITKNLLLALVLTSVGPTWAAKHLPGNAPVPKADPGNNNGPPSGAILDLGGTLIPGGGDGVTQQVYTVNFTATLNSTVITFAVRDDYDYIHLYNVTVTDLTAGTAVPVVNGTFGPPFGLPPVGWIYSNPYGATNGGTDEPPAICSTSNCYYDGAVQAYDEISQAIPTIPGHVYRISFAVAESSGCQNTPSGGPPCYFSDLSTNGDTTDDFGNGVDLLVYAGPGLPAPFGADAFQVNYASNLNIGDSVVNVTNTGASVLSPLATAGLPLGAANSIGGNICVGAYVFDQSEELLACCSCLVTPNGLASFSVKNQLISNNLTPEIPNSVVIKLLATVAGTSTSATSCNAATPTLATLAPGMRAWGTTLHALPTSPVRYGLTENRFSISALSQAELNHLTSFCGFIQSNGSGFGVCKGCSVGGLGAATNP